MLPLLKQTSAAKTGVSYLMAVILTLLSISLNAQEKPTKKMLFGSGVVTTQIPSFQGYGASSFSNGAKTAVRNPELESKIAAMNNVATKQWLLDSLNKQNRFVGVTIILRSKDGEPIEITPKLDSLIKQRLQN